MHFQVVVVQRLQRNVQEKCYARVNLLFFLIAFFGVLVAVALVVAKAPYSLWVVLNTKAKQKPGGSKNYIDILKTSSAKHAEIRE